MKTKAKNKAIIYFVLMLPFIEPQLFKIEEYQRLDKVYALTKIVSSVLVIFIYLYKKMCRVSITVLLMGLMQLMILLSTIYNKGSLSRFFGPALISIVVLMIGQLVMSSESGAYFLKYIENYLSIFIVIHSIWFVYNVVSGGLFNLAEETILGINNRWIYMLLPWTIIGFVNAYIVSQKITWKEWGKYFLSLFFVLVSWSVGALVAFIGFGGAYWFARVWIRNMKNRINFVKFYIGILVYNVLLVTEILLEPLRYVVISIFNKDITLSGRVYLWRTVISELKENIIFAKGVQPHEVDMNYFYVKSGWVQPCKVNHPHNYFLNVAHQGGLIALILFITIWWMCMKWLNKMNQRRFRELPVVIFSSFVSFFLAASVDTMDYSLFYLLIPISIYVGREFGERKYAVIDSNSSV